MFWIVPIAFGSYFVAQWFKYRKYLKSIDYNRGESLYRSNSYQRITSIEFKTFKEIYQVNPNRWSYVIPSYASTSRYDKYKKIKQLIYKPEGKYGICIKFSFFDWIKFKWWNLIDDYKNHVESERKEKREAKEKENYATKLLLESVQLDIDSLREKAEKEINEAKNVIKEATR